MNVSISPELAEMVQSKVQSGHYHSASEVIQEALRLLEQRDNLRAADLKDLRSRIDEGLASLDRGEGVDGEECMQRMLADLDSLEARRKAG